MASYRAREIVIGGLVMAALALQGGSLMACASCPCGSEKPMILTPAEEWKLYLGLARNGAYRNIDSNGLELKETGPDVKVTLTSTLGKSINNRAFLSVTVPFLINTKDGRSKSGVGDISMGGRYTLLFQSFIEPWIPQIQLLGSYKYARAKSVYDSEDQDRMDVFGGGMSEYEAGVDVWFGMYDAKVGFSQTFGFPQVRTFADVEIAPGRVSRTTVTLGYGIDPYGTVLGGVNREAKREIRTDGIEIFDSNQISHSPFLTYEAKLSDVDTVRATWLKQAEAHFVNKNVTRSTGVTLAYLRSF